MQIELVLEDAQNELVLNINELCNKYNLSYSLLEIIFKNIHNEINEKKIIELKEMRRQYEESQKQKEAKTKESERDGDK